MDKVMVCENCEKELNYQACVPARNLKSRIEVGEVYTDVECPDCGALCHLKKTERESDAEIN